MTNSGHIKKYKQMTVLLQLQNLNNFLKIQ